jgi:CBS domain-containing protein
MRSSIAFTLSFVLILLCRSAIAEDVDLPAPVLQWSVYILLMFAVAVGIGIFFGRGKNGKNAPLGILLNTKEREIHSVEPGTSVMDCVRLMNEEQIGAMLVMETDRLLGIFTERDAITRVLGKGLDPAVTSVSEVMTAGPLCVATVTTLGEAMSIVTKQRIRHLPVVEDERVLGVVSSGDLTRWLVEDQAGEIQELVYVAGRRRNTQ